VGTECSALGDDLKLLRRGVGVQDPRISTKIGLSLRQACGVLPEDPAGVVSGKVLARLEELVDRLPGTQRGLARAVFGFDGSDGENYTARLRAYGDMWSRDVRTVQRWANEVVERVAELLTVAEPAPARREEPPWYTVSLRVLLVLDQPEVEVFETRRIRSRRPGLAEIEHSMTVAPVDGVHPVALPALGIDVVNGGDVGSITRIARNRVTFRLRPPQVLDTHDEHEFTLRVRLPRISPFYVCTPLYPCAHFDLRVRFGRHRTPARVWRIEGELSMEACDPTPVRPLLEVNSANEVHATFDDLEPAKSYGIGWLPPDG
jgi:hypothetical protein